MIYLTHQGSVDLLKSLGYKEVITSFDRLNLNNSYYFIEVDPVRKEFTSKRPHWLDTCPYVGIEEDIVMIDLLGANADAAEHLKDYYGWSDVAKFYYKENENYKIYEDHTPYKEDSLHNSLLGLSVLPATFLGAVLIILFAFWIKITTL